MSHEIFIPITYKTCLRIQPETTTAVGNNEPSRATFPKATAATAAIEKNGYEEDLLKLQDWFQNICTCSEQNSSLVDRVAAPIPTVTVSAISVAAVPVSRVRAAQAGGQYQEYLRLEIDVFFMVKIIIN